jgi:hypothetical protein
MEIKIVTEDYAQDGGGVANNQLDSLAGRRTICFQDVVIAH